MDFVGKRYWFFLFSGLIIIPGLIYLLLFGLRPGIEFTSGSMLNLQFSQAVDQGDLRRALEESGHPEAIVQRTGENNFLVRLRTLRDEALDEQNNISQPGEKQQVVETLANKFGKVDLLEFNQVSPIVAEEAVRNSFLAVVAASFGIMLYVTFAFRKVPKPFRYGTCIIVALLHDTLVLLGTFAILGKHFNVEIDSMFITATLTVVGFSVHDTIVVFDRIRENLRKGVGETFPWIVNYSLVQTLNRSLNTSLTVIFTLVALLLFGGATIHTFLLALLVGMISGTYSSIFNASQLLVAWEAGDFRRLWDRLRGRPALAAAAPLRPFEVGASGRK